MNENQLESLKNIKLLAEALLPDTVIEKRIAETIVELVEDIEKEENRME